MAARREAERRAAAEALAGGELPEGFGEEYNVFLAEPGAAIPGGEGFNPLLEGAIVAPVLDDLDNPFLDEDEDDDDDDELAANPFLADEDSEPAKA